MKSKLATAFGLLLLLTALVLSSNQTESADAGGMVGADLVYKGADLPEGSLDGLITAENRLMLSETAVTGRYLSPVLDPPIAFNALVPQWMAYVPDSGSFSLQVRTGTADNRWGEWVLITVNEDWTLPDAEQLVGQMITVPAVEQTHQRFQFALSFGRYQSDPSPILKELRFSFIDASKGPSSAELAAMQAEQAPLAAESGDYPKPPVIGRDLWCTDPACNYTEGLTYEPVTHLLLHHTVSSNDNSDWAAVVRAVWYYHTFVLEWGDIGYQYLADVDGNLYEGHLGGDDVVGIHAGAANAGSMALSLLGTFTNPDDEPPGIAPPPAMLEAAAELFAWKAYQKNIDVYGAGSLPNMNWGLPYLSGHRDVYGTTVCPGDQAHLTLPWLRNEVAERVGYVPVSQYVDELSPDFTNSSGDWNVPPAGCGNNGHAYYAWSTMDPGSEVMWGEWHPTVTFPGLYEIEVYAPYCITGAPETDGATYAITDTNGTSTVTVSHNDHVGNWMSLGVYDLSAGNDALVRLTNLTTTDTDLGVWFDAIRIRPILIAPTGNIIPLQDSWQPRNVSFTWDVPTQVVISSTRFQVSENGSFYNLLLDVPLPPTTTSFNHTFTQDYANLYWRVLVTTPENASSASEATRFGIDSAEPTSLITYIYQDSDGSYRLFWSGSDATSGINSYALQYRADITTTWTTWLTDTTQTTAIFEPPDGDTYWFRSQATDVAGNVEPLHPDPGDLSTDQALSLSRAIMLPIVFKQ